MAGVECGARLEGGPVRQGEARAEDGRGRQVWLTGATTGSGRAVDQGPEQRAAFCGHGHCPLQVVSREWRGGSSHCPWSLGGQAVCRPGDRGGHSQASGMARALGGGDTSENWWEQGLVAGH